MSTKAQSFENHFTCSEQAAIKRAVLSRVQSVNIIRPRGDWPNCIFCQAKHCVEVVFKPLAQKNEVKHRKNASGIKRIQSNQNTCLTVALKAPKMAAAPPQSLFIPGIVV